MFSGFHSAEAGGVRRLKTTNARRMTANIKSRALHTSVAAGMLANAFLQALR